MPGDYNGDGTTNLAVYRRITGAWYVAIAGRAVWRRGGHSHSSRLQRQRFTDIAIYGRRPAYSYVRNQFAVQFGERGDRPVPADYNGDGASDVAVYRVTTGTWYVRNQSYDPGGQPVPGDYDGDGTEEPSGYYPTHGQ